MDTLSTAIVACMVLCVVSILLGQKVLGRIFAALAVAIAFFYMFIQ